MKFNKIKDLIESNKELKLTKNNDYEIVIESSRSANKLKASLNENKLKISLENELGGEIENYESPVISSNDLVDKIKDAINLYDMIDELNIDFEESDNIEEIPEDDLGEEIELIDAETGEEVTDTNADTCCNQETPVGDFDNDGEDEELLNEETNPFSEIIDMMSNSESYDELYTAAGLIKDDSLRTDVEELLGQCEDDGDDVETAYSAVTSDLLNGKVNDLNESKQVKDIYLKHIAKAIGIAKEQAKGLSLEMPSSGELMNNGSVVTYRIKVGRNHGADIVGLCDFIKDTLKELINDGSLDISVTPESNTIVIGIYGKDIVETESLEPEINDEDISTRLLNIQNSITNTAKELSDIATETNDTEMMSVIMDLANSVSSCALDIEDAMETINDLEESEEGEELEQIDATNENESLLLKLRMNLTESKLIAKKLARKDSENKGLYEKYINSVNDIL